MLENFKVIDIVKACGDSTISFSEKFIKFNKATASEMHCPEFVRMLINTETKQFAIQACEEANENSLKFSKPNGQHYTISIYNRPILEVVRRLMKWPSEMSYRCFGAYFPDAKAMVYDLKKAILINPAKDEEEVEGIAESTEA